MKKIKVLNEYLPERCEVCHKNDLYDGLTNNCLRCKAIINSTRNKSFIIKPIIIKKQHLAINIERRIFKSIFYGCTLLGLLIPIIALIIQEIKYSYAFGYPSKCRGIFYPAAEILIVFICSFFGSSIGLFCGLIFSQLFRFYNYCKFLFYKRKYIN